MVQVVNYLVNFDLCIFNPSGHTWAMAESIEVGELEAVDSLSPLPPAVVTQHSCPPRQFILLTTNVIHPFIHSFIYLSINLVLFIHSFIYLSIQLLILFIFI